MCSLKSEWPMENHPSVLPEVYEVCKRFNSVTVQPIAAYNYLCEETPCKYRYSLEWATTVSVEGANFDLPPSVKRLPLPFYQTQPTPDLDVAVRDMIMQNILVVNNNIHCAFELVSIPRLDGTYDVIQDFKYLTQLYPKRQYVKVINNSKSIQRIAPEDKMIKLKLTNMFAQIHISEKTQKFIGVQYRGNQYSMTRLPPHHPRSPHIAQRWAEAVGHIIECKFNVYTVIYQDHWLIHAHQINSLEIINFIQDCLGVSINMQQSITEPTEEIEFLSIMVNSKNQTVYLTDAAKYKLISCIPELHGYDLKAREEVACLWWWVAYHLRLSRHIENEILVGESQLLAITIAQLDFCQLKQLKRANRNIVVYADLLQGRVIAYAPEFKREINKEIKQLTSITNSKNTALIAAIESAKWALDFTPDGVDVVIYINCISTFLNLTKGTFEALKYIINHYIDLYKNIKSRNIVWQCTESKVSINELLQHFDNFDVPQHVRTLLIPNLLNSKTTSDDMTMCSTRTHQHVDKKFPKRIKFPFHLSLPYTRTPVVNESCLNQENPSLLLNSSNYKVSNSIILVNMNCSSPDLSNNLTETSVEQHEHVALVSNTNVDQSNKYNIKNSNNLKEHMLAKWVLRQQREHLHRPLCLPLPPWGLKVLHDSSLNQELPPNSLNDLFCLSEELSNSLPPFQCELRHCPQACQPRPQFLTHNTIPKTRFKRKCDDYIYYTGNHPNFSTIQSHTNNSEIINEPFPQSESKLTSNRWFNSASYLNKNNIILNDEISSPDISQSLQRSPSPSKFWTYEATSSSPRINEGNK